MELQVSNRQPNLLFAVLAKGVLNKSVEDAKIILLAEVMQQTLITPVLIARYCKIMFPALLQPPFTKPVDRVKVKALFRLSISYRNLQYWKIWIK